MENRRGSEWRKWDLHIHTASSYDSKYKAEDADMILCQALRDNEISAVAITDHFIIDNDRIKHLRELEPEIVFFPGVELRTDKGADNLHLILIFSEKIDLDTLAADFEAIMIRNKAKAKESEQTIYWDYNDIVEFCNSHGGLLSIHAGKKPNGMDEEISNTLPVNMAIKKEIAESVDFYEVGRLKDIDNYYAHVFNFVDEKPLIMCSDCHDPRKYCTKEYLWIKANLTFEGLKQCIYQPKERVYIGAIPPVLDRVEKNKKANIDKISTHRVENSRNPDVCWFDFDIPLNPGLVAVIGNKGSGKSAFSDILGQVCKCKTMGSASFLNKNRFRKMPKNYAEDYKAVIEWRDGHSEDKTLDVEDFGTTIEDAQYLPQKYIEEVCNDIENKFQEEIDKVIFSYVDKTERGNATSLSELVVNKSTSIHLEIRTLQNEMEYLNKIIIQLEKKKTTEYSRWVEDSLKKYTELLERHEKNRPQEVKKPVPQKGNTEYQSKLQAINLKITEIEQEIRKYKEEITKLTVAITETKDILAKLRLFKQEIKEIQEEILRYLDKYEIKGLDGKICVEIPDKQLENHLTLLQGKKVTKQAIINCEGDGQKGLIQLLAELEKEKNKIIENSDAEEKKYQKYLVDLQQWETEKKKIIGDMESEGTQLYFKNEKEYLDNNLETEFVEMRSQRDDKFKKLFELKMKFISVYDEIYTPVRNEIEKLLGDLSDSVEFKAEMQLVHNEFTDKILSFVNQRHAGIFKGRTEAHNKMDKFIRSTEFNDIESVLELSKKIMEVVDEDIDNSEKKIFDKKEFYDYLYGLDYVGVSFKLKMGGRSLEELSPGERGIVLLIFYLALSQNSMPIIIDQPEDNLDNQSVYTKLVPCICAAKQKRQVIIVTHNPNIAVACDAEQIICCQMNKNAYKIEYISGAIEDTKIKKSVIDILEGTMPAFDLRKRKYI